MPFPVLRTNGFHDCQSQGTSYWSHGDGDCFGPAPVALISTAKHHSKGVRRVALDYGAAVVPTEFLCQDVEGRYGDRRAPVCSATVLSMKVLPPVLGQAKSGLYTTTSRLGSRLQAADLRVELEFM